MSGLKPGPRQPIDTMAKFVGGAIGINFCGNRFDSAGFYLECFV